MRASIKIVCLFQCYFVLDLELLTRVFSSNKVFVRFVQKLPHLSAARKSFLRTWIRDRADFSKQSKQTNVKKSWGNKNQCQCLPRRPAQFSERRSTGRPSVHMGTRRWWRGLEWADQWLLGGNRGQLRNLPAGPHTPGHASTKHGHDATPRWHAHAGPTWSGYAPMPSNGPNGQVMVNRTAWADAQLP